MTLRQRIADQGRKAINNPLVLKCSTDDRVKRAAESVLDIRGRAQEAWGILVNGHALPAIDPSLDDSIGQTEEQFTRNRIEENALSRSNGDGKAAVTILSRPLDFNDGPEAQINGKRVTMFGSNNHLGLTTHPKVREAARAAIDRFGTSMTGSRLVNGSMRLHEEFEAKLATWFGKESALVFTTGYQVNLAVRSALLSNRKCVAVVDRNIHASLYDGVRLGQAAGARLVRYRHNDAESLERALQKLDTDEGALVITDGVFSAEGEIAKLDQIVPIAKKYGARLLVDEHMHLEWSDLTVKAPLTILALRNRLTSSAALSRSPLRALAAGLLATERRSTTCDTLLRLSCSLRALHHPAWPQPWPRSTLCRKRLGASSACARILPICATSCGKWASTWVMRDRGDSDLHPARPANDDDVA
jgi:hypothetical protein